MACQFSLPVVMPVDQLYEMARKALLTMGGEMGGDETKGAFRIRQGSLLVEGLYRTEPGWFHVQLTRKPFLLSCNKVKDLLTDALVQAEKAYGGADGSALAA